MGDVDGTSAIELGLRGAVGLEAGYFFPEGGLEGFEGDVGFGSDVALGDGAQLQVIQRAIYGLGDLLLVDEFAVEAAGFAVSKDVDEEVSFGVARGEGAGGEPGDGEAWELDSVSDGGALLGSDGRGFDGDGFDCGTFGDRSEVFGEKSFELGGVEVAGDGDAGVIGGVELLVKVANVVDAGGFDVGVGADDGGVVGMLVGEEHVVDLLVGEIVGGAFALAALVAHDVALVGELDAIEAFEEEAHAVAFEPEGKLELIAGDGLEVVGTVEVGGAVDVGCACALEIFEVGLFADMLGAFKHHVLEEVGEAGAAGALVERADVIPEVDGDEREAMVFVCEDDETIGEGELFVFELWDLERLCGREGVGGICDGGEGEGGEKSGGFQAMHWCHIFSPRRLAKACKIRMLG
jgi:hypothetical protein